ncbi:MAG: response regulator transcription factor, partial [Lachnospiraceae bacterium]|nr:response regulator transcription factor [Lachnospiraceae bacterium]
KVVIAEDYKMVREVFENTIRESEDYQLKASFPTAVQAVEYLNANPADLVLMDVLFPGSLSGLKAAKQIKERHPEIKILIVTSMPEISYISQAKEIGIESFWYKEVQEQPLIEIMNRTMAGESVYPLSQPKVALGNAFSDELTERETAVLRELVSGASNKEIGDKLGITDKTVKMHITNMLQKTGYHSRLELAVKARHYGIAIKDDSV